MSDKYVEHNGSGYIDETVDMVIKNEYNHEKRLKEDLKYKEMSKDIRGILEENGYVLEGPISLINKSNGRKRRIY